MKISEIFFSLQGEGGLAGTPSIFIRSSGCNLRCSWCDTPYTSWQPEGSEMPVEEILDEAAKYSARHVVFTGGEPMLMPQAPALTAALRERGYHITVETAGTLFAAVACDLMSISPKLANSTPLDERWAPVHERTRMNIDVLRRLTSEYPYQLKFVVAAPGDIAEIQDVVRAIGADASRVMLMPEGTGLDQLRERAPWISALCLQHGYRYSPRLHIELYGNRRGV